MPRLTFLALLLLICSCENAVKFNNANTVSSCEDRFNLEDRTISGEPGEEVLINIDDLTRPLTIEFRDRLSFHLIATRSVPAGLSRVKLPEIAGAYEMIVKNNCGSTGYSYATATISTTEFSPEPTKRLTSIGNTVSTYSAASIMSSADIDLDGDMDFMYLVPDPDASGGYVPEFKVHLNDGLGNFSLSPTLSTYGTSYSTWFSLTDVTGDGRVDLVYSIQNPIAGVCIRAWNTITSKFGSELCSLYSQVSTDPDTINKFQLHDFNRDGNVDIAMAVNEHNGTAFYDGSLIMMLGRGDGTFFQISGVNNLGPIHNFIIADINNDGLVDVTIASSDVSTQMLYNIFLTDPETGLIDQDDKTVYASFALFDDSSATGIRSLNVTDINDDQILDFVAASESSLEQAVSFSGGYVLSSNSSMITQYSGSLALADIDHSSQGEELFQGMKNRAHLYSYTGDFGGTLFLKEGQYVEDLDWDSSNTILNDLSSANWRFISHHMMDYNNDGHIDVLQLDGNYQRMVHLLKGGP